MNAERRVLVSGMGGELGSRVAALLELEPWVAHIEGLDVDPPRRRLRRAGFHMIEPGDRRRTLQVLRDVDPHVIVHVGVYEPDARAGPALAAARTSASSVHVLGGAVECPSLEAIVVRSGIEVYGRRRGAVTRPDETTPTDPTSAFGRMLDHVERLARQAGEAAEVPVTLVRLGSVVGPHVPSPLGRYLRLPAVPVSLLADPAFSLTHVEDAAAALVAAAARHWDGPVNVVSTGAVTTSQAVRMGARIPVPLVGPEWPAARVVAALAGAPVPDHVLELIHRGRTADCSLLGHALGIGPAWSTPEVVRHLFKWATVTHLRPAEEAA